MVRRIRRARAGVGAAFADGHGPYLLAMIAFGAAATFLLHALTPERLYHDALDKLITFQQEPFRGETHSVISAGLLPDSMSRDFCKDRELLAETDRIANLFSTSLAAPPAASEKLVPCEPSNERCPKLTAQVGVAMTDLAEHSTLFVPSTIAALVQADPNSVALLLASRRLEDHRQTLGRQFQAGRLATMYFISLAGAIRLLPATSLQGLPAHRTFAGAGYVYTTLSGYVRTTSSGAVYTALPGDVLQCPDYGQSRTLTRPYFDVMEFGLVRTLCQRITSPPNNVVGTMCFDFTPRETVTYHMLADAS
ncbi:MAG TPA: hypothetical protein VK607_07250, partial [Kofleriaceae bacterium]|nr:hypothetical protein [Kofleriaceae bacterium]